MEEIIRRIKQKKNKEKKKNNKNKRKGNKKKKKGKSKEKKGKWQRVRARREREREKDFFFSLFSQIYGNWIVGFRQRKMQSRFTHQELRVDTKILEFRQTP